MCGIIGAVGQEGILESILRGLQRMEYRGYDSAGVLLLGPATPGMQAPFLRRRVVGKVEALQAALQHNPLNGTVGIGHTRWATHGKATESNAHPHCSDHLVGIVHNGIIENYVPLRQELTEKGYVFTSETDTEVIAHLLQEALRIHAQPLLALRAAVERLQGRYAFAAVFADSPDTLYGVQQGSPLLVGTGDCQDNSVRFLVSDPWALAGRSAVIQGLLPGDVAVLSANHVRIYNAQGGLVERPRLPDTEHLSVVEDAGDLRAGYRHFMHKEIAEQPRCWQHTWQSWLRMREEWLAIPRLNGLHIVACGSSYHAACAARYLFEAAGIATQIEIASEYRYRSVVVPANTLFLAISQSGETADTLAALHKAEQLPYAHYWSMVNVPHSAMTRTGVQVAYTAAGTEIGVASTKAFTTQLMLLLLMAWSRTEGVQVADQDVFMQLPRLFEQLLPLEAQVSVWAAQFVDKQHALFLGRGALFPIAQEGALKLKEISYIHAEAYPAGELKHGPLALVDAHMPVLVLAPQNDLLAKIRSNIEEVRARNGILYVVSDDPGLCEDAELSILRMPACPEILKPIVYTVPLQWFAYHVAVLRGTDVDCPRNLAKSVTVE